ncbi:YfhO family protein, partial [bacterium]|nr:YfhO family protein [bacterium]
TRPAEDAKDFFAQTPDVQFLKSRKEPFRILPAAEQRPANWYAYHFIENADGYSAAKLRIYRDLLEAFDMPRGFIQKYVNSQYRFIKPEEVRPEAIAVDHIFLRLLNVRYILSPYPLPDTSMNVVLSPRTRGGNFVFELKNPLDRIFFPREVRLAEGRDAILSFMKSPGFDPAVTAVLEKAPPFAIQASDENQASLVSRGIHHMEIEAQIRTPCLMTVSEIYYPAGWKATVDGKKTEIFKTDYVLRSVFLEPGSHRIRFDFKPESFKSGLAVSLASFVILAGFCVWGSLSGRKKSGPTAVQPATAETDEEESAQS